MADQSLDGNDPLLSPKNFPPLKNDRILKVIEGKKPDKLPVWIMRQAGRHLPEFREFRKLHEFEDICKSPELACEVTLMPIRRYDLDAAIIFSDILLVIKHMGVQLQITSAGVDIQTPLAVDNVDQFLIKPVSKVVEELAYVGKAITWTRHKLEGQVPIFGFSGAPWTLMVFAMDSFKKQGAKARRWLYEHPTLCDKVLDYLTDIVIEYLVMQIEAGAQIVQVFESCADFLNREMFEKFEASRLAKIRSGVHELLDKKKIPRVPMVLFAKGGHYCLDRQIELGYDVVSIDWSIEPSIAREVAPSAVLQGNFDPCALYGSSSFIKARVEQMVFDFGTSNYIVNLGHGIDIETDPKAVKCFIDAVHSIVIP